MVDFSTPIHLAKYEFFYAKDSNSDEMDWHTFLRPFHQRAWITMLAYLALLTAFFIANLYLTMGKGQGRLVNSITQALKIVYLTVLNKNPGGFSSQGLSQKVMVFVASLVGFTLLSLYRAMLGASLAVKIEHKPYSSIGDIVETGTKARVFSALFQFGQKRTAGPKI